MSPIDDELRAALHGRARALEPSPDPLSGIETRARRIRRNRVGAAVAGSALAVAAVAAVVPAVQSMSSAPDPRIPNYAESTGPETQQPSPAPRPDRPAAAVAWGRPLDQQLDQAYLQQWEALNGKPAGSSRGEVLYRGETNDGVQVHVYQLWFDAETAYAVVGHSSEAGPEVVRGTILEPGTRVIDAVVPGTDFPALVIAHDPDLPTVQYAPDGRTFTTIEDADGSGVITERSGPTGTASDRIRLLDRTKRVAYDEPVFISDAGTGGEGHEPAAALDPDQPWAVRGDPSLVTGEQLDALGSDWAQRHGVTSDDIQVQPLHVQEAEPRIEVVYLVRFADNPWMWGVSSLGDNGWQWYAEHELVPGTTALAAALPGNDGERLLVVAAPSAGGAVYAADGSDYQPMTDLEPGVFVHPIAPGDADDRFRVLDGDGNLDDPLFQGPAPDYQNAG